MKIQSTVLWRQLKTSCCVGTQMEICLPICLMDHAVPAAAQTQKSRQPQPQQADKKQQLPKTVEKRLHLCRSARQACLQPAEECGGRLEGKEPR